MIMNNGIYKLDREVKVNRSNLWEVKRIMIKYIRKEEYISIYDANNKMLNPNSCFDNITEDGSNTIFIVPGSQANTASN